jgi:hypothetical protein
MTPEQIFDAALAARPLPRRDGVALDALPTDWAPGPLATVAALAVRQALRGDAEGCARALDEMVRLAHTGHVPVAGCLSCGSGDAWHGELCSACHAAGWAQVGCQTCGAFHLQRPDGHILGGCRWVLDQNDQLPDDANYDAADEADMRQQVLLDLGER